MNKTTVFGMSYICTFASMTSVTVIDSICSNISNVSLPFMDYQVASKGQYFYSHYVSKHSQIIQTHIFWHAYIFYQITDEVMEVSG